jgi:hypothetical protein
MPHGDSDARPTLALSALDDPVVPGDCLPYTAVRSSSHFVLGNIPHGGHLGWFDGPLTGPDRHRRWHTQPTMEFFRGVLCDLVYPCDDKTPSLERNIDYDGWSWTEGTKWKVIAEFEV